MTVSKGLLDWLLLNTHLLFIYTFILCNFSAGDDDDAGAIDDNEEVSSQTGSETQEESNLLGEYWNSVCTLTLALEVPEESQGSDGMRLLKVLNNSYGDSEGSCLLRITDEGVI